MSGHDRFEALAGAIALGEATPAERESFAAHAAGCTDCRADFAAAVALAAAFEEARASERWRPAVGDAVARRIRETRRARENVMTAVLGWCVALALVVDGAFATGVAGRLGHAFDARRDTASVAAAARPAAPSAARAVTHPAPARAQRAAAAPARVPFRVAARAHPAAPARAAGAAAEAPIPDVLAGLELSGNAHPAARNVAVLRP